MSARNSWRLCSSRRTSTAHGPLRTLHTGNKRLAVELLYLSRACKTYIVDGELVEREKISMQSKHSRD